MKIVQKVEDIKTFAEKEYRILKEGDADIANNKRMKVGVAGNTWKIWKQNTFSC